MSGMSELDANIKELRSCGETIIGIADALAGMFSSEESPAAPERVMSMEEVRAVLAAKSSEGGGKYRSQVRTLLRKYSGTGKLSGVDPKDYQALLAELEVVSDAP